MVADEDLPAAHRHGLAGGLEVGAADGVVDDVGAVAAGALAHVGGDVGGRGVDHLDRAARMPDVGLRRALHAEHLGARHGRELDRGLADLAVGAEHEDDVAGA